MTPEIVPRLTLGLFVDAENNGTFWRVEIEPDHVDALLLEVRVVRQLERLTSHGLISRAR